MSNLAINIPKTSPQTLIVFNSRTNTVSTYPYNIEKCPEPELFEYNGESVVSDDSHWMVTTDLKIIVNQ